MQGFYSQFILLGLFRHSKKDIYIPLPYHLKYYIYLSLPSLYIPCFGFRKLNKLCYISICRNMERTGLVGQLPVRFFDFPDLQTV